MRDTVRYAARLAVYDEHTMSVKSHQLPMTILRATEATTPSPPTHTHTGSSNLFSSCFLATVVKVVVDDMLTRELLVVCSTPADSGHVTCSLSETC